MISTHILDTSLGKPAVNVTVKLYAENGQLISQSKTNADGRVMDFDCTGLSLGMYSIEFSTAEYFQNLSLDTFFPKAIIHFYVKDLAQHYHIPLLISPFAYSTYRGS